VHGLILAGGLGSRLSSDGVPEPKPLVVVDGRPQLLRLCDTLEALGCESVTCLVRSGVPVQSVLGEHPRRRVVTCTTPTSLHTLALGFDLVPPGPVFCTMVDTVMPGSSWLAVWTAWEACLADDRAVLLAVTRPPARDPDALRVRVDRAGRAIVIGPRAGGAAVATAGVYGFGSAARPRAAAAVQRGVERMRGFLASLVEEGFPVSTIFVPRALDLDRRDDLDEANAWAPAVLP
jgi:MobA-like NTP transferase domain